MQPVLQLAYVEVEPLVLPSGGDAGGAEPLAAMATAMTSSGVHLQLLRMGATWDDDGGGGILLWRAEESEPSRRKADVDDPPSSSPLVSGYLFRKEEKKKKKKDEHSAASGDRSGGKNESGGAGEGAPEAEGHGGCSEGESAESEPEPPAPAVLWLRSDHPLASQRVPCRCLGFVGRRQLQLQVLQQQQQQGADEGACVSEHDAVATGSTLVRILPPAADGGGSWRLLSELTGEVPEEGEDGGDDEREGDGDGVFLDHGPDAVAQLALRVRATMQQHALVGTTRRAVELRDRGIQRRVRLKSAAAATAAGSIRSRDGGEPPGSAISDGIGEKCDGAASNSFVGNGGNAPLLVVHSPWRGHGKTRLVRAVARRVLSAAGGALSGGSRRCRVHVVRAGPLLARYGADADAALETAVHGICVAAAARGDPACVVLDGLEAFLPPSSSNTTNSSGSGLSTSNAGDAAMPVVTGMAAYLQRLVTCLDPSAPGAGFAGNGSIHRQCRQVPFPTQNPLYQLYDSDGGQGDGGWALQVRLCLVAVATCPDGDADLLDRLRSTSRFRLPALSAASRHRAFERALRGQRTELSPDLRRDLFRLSAGATWAMGGAFQKVARHVSHRTSAGTGVAPIESSDPPATVADFVAALNLVAPPESRATDVEFVAQQQDDGGTEGSDSPLSLFPSVGGNEEAKAALEDALSLDPRRRELLRSWGMAPPTGVLLYGPPGTGKTLLARAVAQLLKGSASGGGGGAFISLRSTDVARAEVGAGEKIVASAFETARVNAPAVVFIDEFQALFLERGSGGGSSRLTTTLLQCMDDIKRWSDADYLAQSISGSTNDEGTENRQKDTDEAEEQRVVVLAATNTPWMIDKAFLRPGRFDRAVHVGLPTPDERASILLVHIRRMRMEGEDGDGCEEVALSRSKMCDRLSQLTEGFSGADLSALCRAAAIRSLLENKQNGVEEKHFVDALENDVKPSTSQSLVERIRRWRLL